MKYLDIVAGPLYAIVVYMIAYILKNRLTNPVIEPYYYKCLHIKMLGGLAFALIYQFYYGSGDTFGYFLDATNINKMMFDYPALAFQLYLPGSTSDPIFISKLLNLGYHFRYYNFNGEEWVMNRILAIFRLLGMGSYLGTTFLLSFTSFLGLWKLYQAFTGIYPKLYKIFAYACFYMPSAVFWGSGILKDTVTLTCIALFCYASLNVLYYKRKVNTSVWIMIISAYLIIHLKGYVIITFIPALAFWYYSSTKDNITNPLIKILAVPVIVIVSLVGGTYLVTTLAASTSKYSSIDKIEHKIQAFQGDHGREKILGNNSRYSLGEIEFTPLGMLKAIPAAINVTLFRPYLWEAKNWVMLMSALEGLFFQILVIYLFLKIGIKTTLQTIWDNPEMQLCLIYVLILGFAVGISAYNFGALTRFKIPILPFFGMGLAILWHIKLQKQSSAF
ncbi:MAG: hypothetical protein NZM38_11300 [Cytophagales bacterium]|nr:hypothetical protein [Cytophagales bacterium]MDW8385342.1 hypothetical protein [Flammeovirgaceae bacterium]